MKFDDDDEFENEPIEPIPGQMCYDELLTPLDELEEEKPDTSIAAGQLDIWNLKPEKENKKESEKQQEKIEKNESETKKNEQKNEIKNQNFEAKKIEKKESSACHPERSRGISAGQGFFFFQILGLQRFFTAFRMTNPSVLLNSITCHPAFAKQISLYGLA